MDKDNYFEENASTEKYVDKGDGPQFFNIKVLPWGLRLTSRQGETLQQALSRGGIYVENPCGGKGTCGKCIVYLKTVSEVDAKEVLSCQTILQEDGTITVPLQEESGDTKSDISALTKEIELEPCVKSQKVNLEHTEDSYEEELFRQIFHEGAKKKPSDLKLLQQISLFGGQDENLNVITIEEEPVELHKALSEDRQLLGIAIDLGTTTVMGALMDLNKGISLATTSQGNLQSFAGADVISRSNHGIQTNENLEELQSKTIETINSIIDELIKEYPVNRNHIFEVVVVGNTTMMHLLAGLSPRSLVYAPYHPVLRSKFSVSASSLDIKINTDGKIYFTPCVSGYVGADALSATLATGIHLGEHPRLLIDIGTNGEMVMGWKDRVAACSTAAGPAFEGSRLRYGMRGIPGAIERVDYINGDFDIGVINKKTPRGICGSGLVDAVAALLKAEVITSAGRFKSSDNLSSNLRKRLIEGEQGKEFLLATPEETQNQEGVSLNRKDIGELQLAKGAICAGVKILLKYLELEMSDLEEVLLAGAFGNYLRKESASDIGLWPAYSLNKIRSVGNAAGMGAQMLLLSGSLRNDAEELYHRIEHLNLGSHPDFTTDFTNSMMLGSNV